MEVDSYDPCSFLQPYTQSSEGGLPPALQEIIQGYLSDLAKRYSQTMNWCLRVSSREEVQSTPSRDLVRYLSTLVELRMTDRVAQFIEWYFTEPRPPNVENSLP